MKPHTNKLMRACDEDYFDKVLQNRNQNQMRIILMKTAQVMPKMAILQSDRERREPKSQFGNGWDLIYHHHKTFHSLVNLESKWTLRDLKQSTISGYFSIMFSLTTLWLIQTDLLNSLLKIIIWKEDQGTQMASHRPCRNEAVSWPYFPDVDNSEANYPYVLALWSFVQQTHLQTNKWWKETFIYWFSSSCTSMTMTICLEQWSKTLTSCSKFDHWLINCLRNLHTKQKCLHWWIPCTLERQIAFHTIYSTEEIPVSDKVIYALWRWRAHVPLSSVYWQRCTSRGESEPVSIRENCGGPYVAFVE